MSHDATQHRAVYGTVGVSQVSNLINFSVMINISHQLDSSNVMSLSKFMCEAFETAYKCNVLPNYLIFPFNKQGKLVITYVPSTFF